MEPEEAKMVNKPDKILSVEKITPPSTKPTVHSTNTVATPTLIITQKGEPSDTETVIVQVEKQKPDEGVKEKAGEEKSGNKVKVEKIVSPEEAKTEAKVEKLSPMKSEAGGKKKGVTVSVEKITAKEETNQKDSESGRNKEKEEEESVGSVVVEKVGEKENEKEKKVPAQFSVQKIANDEGDSEELDLAVGEEAERSRNIEQVASVEKVSPEKEELAADANEETANEKPLSRISVEKITGKIEGAKETVNGPKENTVVKVVVDERENEEEDLESDGAGESQAEEAKERKERDRAGVPDRAKVENLAHEEGENEEKDLESAGTGDEEKAASDKQKESHAEKETVDDKTDAIPSHLAAEKVANDEADEDRDLDREGKETNKLKAAEEKDKVPVLVTVSVEKVTVDAAENEKKDRESGETGKREMADSGKERANEEVGMKETEGNVMVTVEKVAPASPRLTTDSEEEKSPSTPPTSESPKVSVGKVEKISSEEEDLKNSKTKENSAAETFPSQGKRPEEILGDANKKADEGQDEEQELEDEQEQQLERKEESPEERKLALAFEKALEEERNKKENLKTHSVQMSSPLPSSSTSKPHEPTTKKTPTTQAKETESGKEPAESQNIKVTAKSETTGGLSVEELELAALADEALSDDKKEMKPLTAAVTTKATATTIKVAAATTTPATVEKVVDVKVEKQPKVAITVTKEKNEKLLSEKQTAQEERKLKEELTKEIEQEKSGVSIRINLHYKVRAVSTKLVDSFVVVTL